MHPATGRREALAARAAALMAASGGRMPVAAIARRLDCPVSQLSRAFRRARGRTLTAYRTEVRLAQAIERLRRDPSADLTDVALACGYSSHSHFTATFRAHIGMTPSAVTARLLSGPEQRPAWPAPYDTCSR